MDSFSWIILLTFFSCSLECSGGFAVLVINVLLICFWVAFECWVGYQLTYCRCSQIFTDDRMIFKFTPKIFYCLYIYVYIYISLCMYMYIYICMCVHRYIYTHVYMYRYVWCANIQIYIYIYVYMDICTHTYPHTNMLMYLCYICVSISYI